MTLAARLRALCEHSPPGTLVQLPVDWLRAELEAEGTLEASRSGTIRSAADPLPVPATWRERLWTAPAETRLGVAEVCEAFGRPKSWLYRHTSAGTIPHRKFDGELLFVVGELRAWAREREEAVHSAPMESTTAERAGWDVHSGRRVS